MRRLATIASILIVLGVGFAAPAAAQDEGSQGAAVVVLSQAHTISPLGIYAIGALACTIAAPMINTAILGRPVTPSEFARSALGCAAGPIGWLLAPQLFPFPFAIGQLGAPSQTPKQPQGNGNSHPPRSGETHFVPNEVLIVFAPGTPPTYIQRLARRLHLTVLETQNFSMTGLTLTRFRIDGSRSVVSILRTLNFYGRVVLAQPNYLYLLQQSALVLSRAASLADAAANQYVVSKLHLLKAHEISTGADVSVAVVDSKIDTSHPDLAGSVAAEFDAVGGQAAPHAHGTGIAGAIAAHAKLIGVAPGVKILAARVFSGSGDKAQGTTFNILKGLDWAASENARIVNMSFAGPSDPLLRLTLAKAHARGMVLIASVGNAGPRARPLYPAAYPHVIGVTATDIDDKLLGTSNRGRQVTLAAPGVDVLVPAPDDTYQLTTGTSVAAANVSGVTALLLARDPQLTPDKVETILMRSAHHLAGPSRDIGAGEVDALSALESLK